jgi:MFS family permease
MVALRWRGLIPDLPPDAWVVLGGDALSAVGSGLTLPFFVVYLDSVRGLSLQLAALALSTIALAGLIGNPVGGWLSDRWRNARPRRAIGLYCETIGSSVSGC